MVRHFVTDHVLAELVDGLFLDPVEPQVREEQIVFCRDFHDSLQHVVEAFGVLRVKEILEHLGRIVFALFTKQCQDDTLDHLDAQVVAFSLGVTVLSLLAFQLAQLERRSNERILDEEWHGLDKINSLDVGFQSFETSFDEVGLPVLVFLGQCVFEHSHALVGSVLFLGKQVFSYVELQLLCLCVLALHDGDQELSQELIVRCGAAQTCEVKLPQVLVDGFVRAHCFDHRVARK